MHDLGVYEILEIGIALVRAVHQVFVELAYEGRHRHRVVLFLTCKMLPAAALNQLLNFGLYFAEDN